MVEHVEKLSREEAIRNAYETLLSDTATAQQMGLNGRKVMEEKYNWDSEAEKLIKLYEFL